MNAPSAFSTARRSILPRSAASTIGTFSAGAASSLKPSTRSPSSTGRRKSTASETIESGFSNGILFQPSTMRSEEAPMPRAKRPPVASARAAACIASRARPRSGTPTTPVPSRAFSVHSAQRASGVKPSGPFVSPVQMSVNPAASARSTCARLSASGVIGSGRVSPQRLTGQPYGIGSRPWQRRRNGSPEADPPGVDRDHRRTDPGRKPLPRVVLARDRERATATSPTTGSAVSATTAAPDSTRSRSCAGS